MAQHFVDWTSLGSPAVGLPSRDTPPVSVGTNPDGRLEVFTVAADGALWQMWQWVPETNWSAWSNWNSLGVPPTSHLVHHTASMAVAGNADGRLEAFAVSEDGRLWHTWQVRTSGAWSSWTSLGKPPGRSSARLLPALTVSMTADGRLVVFAVSTAGAAWHICQREVDGRWIWSTWTSLGTMWPGRELVAAVGSGGRLMAYTAGTDGALWRIEQNLTGSAWEPWTSLGRPPSGETVHAPICIATNRHTSPQVFVVGSSGKLWYRRQVLAENQAGNWRSLGSPPLIELVPKPQYMTMGTTALGQLAVFAVASDGALWHLRQAAHEDVWGSWIRIGTTPTGELLNAPVLAANNAEGDLEVFTVSADGALWHISHIAPAESL